jgi:hypothetical protein
LASQNFSHVSFVRLSAAHGGEYRLPSIMNYVRFTPQSGHWPCTSKGGDRLADASQVYKTPQPPLQQQQQPGADVWRTPPPKRRGWDLSAASFDHLVGERDRRGASPSSTTLNIESFIAPLSAGTLFGFHHVAGALDQQRLMTTIPQRLYR